MLVLTRRMEETVEIEVGGLVMEVRVLRLDGHRVRLGFEGPPQMRVLRGEVSDERTEPTDAAALESAG